MKQIASVYTYNKTTGVITLTGVNINRDQLLLVVNTTRNVTYYNFADSTTTLQSFSVNYTPASFTLNSSVISASSAHANTDALTIYYDDKSTSNLATAVYDGIAGWASNEGGDGSAPIFVGLVGALPAGTNLIGSVSPAQGTTVTNTTFTSITPSTSLVSAVAGRRVLSVFNEGTGVLYISGGVTCTTTSYQVRLGVGEYWECPAGQLSLAHSAVFGTAGSARVSQVT